MVQIRSSSPAGQFLISQGVTEAALNAAGFRVLNRQFGDALTVVWPTGKAMIFMKSKFLEVDDSGELPMGRNLALIRHELHHVQQGHEWGFLKYWTRHLWARVKHRSISAKTSSVEAPAYELQRKARAALEEHVAGSG